MDRKKSMAGWTEGRKMDGWLGWGDGWRDRWIGKNKKMDRKTWMTEWIGKSDGWLDRKNGWLDD